MNKNDKRFMKALDEVHIMFSGCGCMLAFTCETHNIENMT